MILKLDMLRKELLDIEEQIEIYLEDIENQCNNLKSHDLEDEFEGDILIGAAQELKKLGDRKRVLLSNMNEI